jgi:hypothetical protein
MKRGLRDVKGVDEAADDWSQEVADAALARNAEKHLLALLRHLTSLAEGADASPELPGIAETLRYAVAHALGDNPGGAFFLWDAVSAAFNLGSGLAAKDPALRAKLVKYLKQQDMKRARANRHPPESEVTNTVIAWLFDQGKGMEVGVIAQRLGLSKNAVKKRITRMKKTGEI